MEKHNGVNTLVIKHVSEHDAGEYVCQVCTRQFKQNNRFYFIAFQISILNDILSVQHTLDVLGIIYHSIYTGEQNSLP